jgi:G:T-mismatch repair DNA endonuclease (very short patch repair protein)
MKLKCGKCGKEFDNKMFRLHINNSHKNEFINDNEIKLFVIKSRFNLNYNLINELISKYENDGSILDLVKTYKIPHNSLRQLFKLNGVKIKSISEITKQKSVRDKYEKTCLNKYGVTNVSKSDEIKSKKKSTFIKNYGVDNIFKYEEFKNNLNEILLNKYGKKRLSNSILLSKILNNRSDEEKKKHIDKISNTKLNFSENKKFLIQEKRRSTINNRSDEQKKNVSDRMSMAQKLIWNNFSDEQIAIRLKKLHNNKNSISKLEIRVRNILNELNISFKPQFSIGRNTYDIKLNDVNLIIEVNGDFWHANPIKYKENDILNFPNNLLVSAKSLWEKDRKKTEKALKHGFKVITLWEKDINALNNLELEFYVKQKIEDNLNDV